uniref:Reverse transcriptase domain-containing protein n=1 Tax=Tanacetum cinerariifolium TaxID=118510 RepID=A0A6L2N360_TANCI|nr:reverse transcriptase domain-containing protein [Tanacetum cinerariifolium]
MQALKESKKTSRRQPGTRGSDEETGSKPGVLDESMVVFATSSEGTGAKPMVADEDKDITEEKVILKRGDEQDSEFFKDDNDDEKDDKDGGDDDEGDDHVSDTQHDDDDGDEDNKAKSDEDETYKYKICVRNEEDVEMKDAEVKNLIKVKKRVAKMEKDMFELKIIDYSSEALTVLQSYVLTVVDSYLDTKKPTPTAKQESKKIPSEILMIKRKQAKSQKNPQLTIKSTDKAALEEYDLKSALYRSMHVNKSFSKNPANHRLYQALMEALIKDENAMDKGVADTVKDHKKKHDDDEDGDDKDPPTGPNQGKKTKRRRTNESESSKKPSSTKETPKGKAPTKGSKTSMSATKNEPVKEPVTEVIMDDAGDNVVWYVIGVANLKALVHAGDQTSGDASQGSEVNGGVDGVPDFSIIIAQQLQNLLPTIVAQVGNQGRGQGVGMNQNGDAVNDHIQGDAGNSTKGNDRRGCTYKEFLACNPKEYDGKGGAIVYTRWIKKMESVHDMSGFHELATLVPYLVTLESKRIGRNRIIKNNPKKRGKRGEPSKDWNGREDNKRTRTGNAFAMTTTPVRGGYMGTTPKCTACGYYHLPKTPCRSCFNYNRLGHFTKECRVVPRNVNPISTRKPVGRTCFECGSSDHIKSACPRINLAQRLGETNKTKLWQLTGVRAMETKRTRLGVVRIPLLDGKVLRVLGEKPKEKMRQLMSAKSKEKKKEEIVVVRNFPEVWYVIGVATLRASVRTGDLTSGDARSSIELEYNFSECFNALTNKLDWNNPEGDRYPFDLFKPLPLQGPPRHRTIVVDYFFNNDLEYLKTSDPEVTYTTSIMKTKVARYAIKGIEDMVPTLWSTISMQEIVVKRSDQHLYKFKEGDFVDLHLNDNEDMLLLAVQHKLFHLDGSDIVDFIVALSMLTRSLILKRCVQDLQLGVESYYKKLNITKPHKTFHEIEFKEPYTSSYDPP